MTLLKFKYLRRFYSDKESFGLWEVNKTICQCVLSIRYATIHPLAPFLDFHLFLHLISAFFNYISGGAIAPPGKEFAPPVKPFLPPKCEAELLMIAVRIAVDLLDEIMPFHRLSLLHSHPVCNSYCSSPSIS